MRLMRMLLPLSYLQVRVRVKARTAHFNVCNAANNKRYPFFYSKFGIHPTVLLHLPPLPLPLPPLPARPRPLPLPLRPFPRFLRQSSAVSAAASVQYALQASARDTASRSASASLFLLLLRGFLPLIGSTVLQLQHGCIVPGKQFKSCPADMIRARVKVRVRVKEGATGAVMQVVGSSTGQSVEWSVGRSNNLLIGGAVGWTVGPSVGRSVCYVRADSPTIFQA